MTIYNLQCFLMAAQYLNFSKAAEAMYIHPSTMSRCISSMEEEIGTPLFIRLKYSLQLTQAGARLRQEADDIVSRYEQMLQSAKAAARTLQGTLSLLTPQIYFQMLSDAYRVFSEENPQIEFVVDVCPFSKLDTVCRAVEDNVVDLGITFSTNYHDDNNTLEYLKIYEEEQLLTLPLNHPLAKRESCRITELRDTPLLLADHQGKEFLQKLVSVANRNENPIQLMHTASGETLLLRFTAGMGATIMPGIIAKNSGGNFASLKIEDMDTRVDVILVWSKKNRNPAIEAFVECVRNHHPDLHPVETFRKPG